MSSPIYVVTVTGTLSPNTMQIGVQLATPATILNRVIQLDLTFAGINSANTPCRFEICTETSPSASGTAATFNKVNSEARNKGTAGTTVRMRDTTDGSGSTTLATYFVPVVSGQIFQLPLSRELTMDGSSYIAFKMYADQIVAYAMNIWIEE